MKKPTEVPSLETKVGKYYKKTRIEGKQKGIAALEAGYADDQHSHQIESTKAFERIDAYYKTALLNHISLDSIAAEHVKNIVQDQDKGAKNKAIEMAIDRIDPDSKPRDEEESRVIVVLR